MSASQDKTSAFIARWQGVTASELPTAQSFVIELCDLLDVERPHPTPEQHYMFERPFTFSHGDGSTSAGRIDCFKRGAFIWESKKLKPGTQPDGTTSKRFDDALAERFTGRGPWKKRLPQILQTLESLGRARQAEGGWRAA